MSGLRVSFVLATDRFETVREVVRELRSQTMSEFVELVLVCPDEQELDVDADEVRELGAVRIVGGRPADDLEAARAAGVRAASAGLVMIGEAHAYPDPECLERLVARHEAGRYGAISPRLRNANPLTAASWASLLVTYPSLIDSDAAEITFVSSHNTMFRREALLDLGADRLAELMEPWGRVGDELRAHGYALFHEPAATLRHVNVARVATSVADRFMTGRLYAASRARAWSRLRRAAFCAGAPLIPFVVGARLLRSRVWRTRRREVPRGTLAMLALGFVASAAGEAVGCAIGAGSSLASLSVLELHRERYA
jgi:hypothetical protein